LAAGRRSELVREKHSHALRQKQTVIPSFWPQAVGANLFAKNTHSLRQKQTVIPSFWPQAVGANLFAKNTLTPCGRSKP
ncbi:hypothetical protein B0A94_00015, partial [Pseudomonas syringae]|uniref:hypothetical protein n=2 Tax=Pseudomonas syringae TaxID=317 RepID=UPI0010262FD5